MVTVKTIEKLILNEEKKLSWTKLGIWGVLLAGGLAHFLTGPVWLILVCNIVTWMFGGVAGVGARDAIKCNCKSDPSEDAAN